MVPRCSGNCQKVSKKTPLVESEWPLIVPSEQRGTVAFDVFQFFTVAISFSC